MVAFVEVDGTTINVAHIIGYESVIIANEDVERTWVIVNGIKENLELDVPVDVFARMIARACSNTERGVYIPVTPDMVLQTTDTERIDNRKAAPY